MTLFKTPRLCRSCLSLASVFLCASVLLGHQAQAQVQTQTQTTAQAQSQSQAQGQPSAATLVSVNGEPQSVLLAQALLREQLARGAVNSPELQAGVRDSVVQRAVMVQEALKNGLDRQPGVQAQLALARQNVLIQAWQQQTLQSIQLQEADLKAEYQRQIQLLGPREFRVRHLLVQEEATAKLLLEKVRAGTRIADLAAEYSRDESTRQQGGLTEWTPQGQLLPGISQAVQNLKPGQWAPAPVMTPAGWHVVQLEQSRSYVPPDLEKAKPQLVQALLQQRLKAQIDALLRSAKVE